MTQIILAIVALYMVAKGLKTDFQHCALIVSGIAVFILLIGLVDE